MKGFSVFGFQFSVFGFQFSVFGFQFSVVARSLVPSFPRSLVPLFLVPCSSFLVPRSFFLVPLRIPLYAYRKLFEVIHSCFDGCLFVYRCFDVCAASDCAAAGSGGVASG